jgi:hypothetical protein
MALLRPDGDVTVSLSCSTGSSHYALIDESTLDTADYVYKSSNGAGTPGTGSDLCSVGTFTRPGSINKAVGWFYLSYYLGAYGNGSTSFTIKIYTGTTELATSTLTNPSGWYSVTYTGDLTQSEIDDLRVYVYISASDSFTSDGGKGYYYSASTGYCYMAYIEVIPNQTVTPGSITSSAAFGTTNLKLYLLPGSIGSSAAFGSTDISQVKTLAPSGIISGAAYGTAKINFTITASAIASAAAFGTAKLNFIITVPGINSAVAFGTAGISQLGRLAPSGIASSVACGTPALIYNQVITPGPTAPAATFGIARLRLYLIPTPPAPTAAVGTPFLKPQQFLSLSGITTAAAVGEPWLDLHITSAAIAGSAAFGTAIIRNRQLIAPSGFASTTAFGTSLLSQGHLLLSGIASSAAFGSPAVIRFVFHVIITAVYSIDAPDINRIFIIGQDATGADVSGNAITQADVDLVGERLDVRHDPAIPSAAVASAVAAALLAAARLEGKHGTMTIPPHCGLELWDVLSVYDEVANQSSSYRVSGYTFEYDTRQGIYRHILDLCAP